MGDLKTNWSGAPVPDVGTSGAGVTQSGSDPNISMDGASGLQPVWSNPVVSPSDGAESSNSVSGLPSLPNRWEPSDNPAEPPDLTTRNPGTIDQK